MKEENLSFINKVLKNIKYLVFHSNKKSKQIIEDTDNNGSILAKCLITYVAKKKNELLILPSNFDPEAHIAKFPPYLNGFPKNTFNIEKMNVILGLLTEIPANYKNLVDEDGFVPIYTPLVQSHFKDYRRYFDYLLHTHVIRSDFHYSKGERSTGWAWSRQFENQRFIAYRVNQDVDVNSDVENNEIAEYPYLIHWYETKLLRIDRDAALEYVWNEKERKMQDRSQWNFNTKKNRYKYPISQYQAAFYNIYSCSTNDYKAHIDENVHRLFSVLTNMQHELRNFVTYNDLPLVCIDMKNCNPYLACLIFNPEFWKTDSILPLNLYSLPNNIQDRLSIPSLSIMLGNFFNALHGGEFDEYIGIVSSGRMYETIMDMLNETAETNIELNEAKIALFSLFFSKNKSHPYDRGIRKKFKIKFPAVFEIFSIIKSNFKIEGEEKPHARLSCLLQSIESEIVLHRCCKRIWEERGTDVPFFTIHDSIVTTVGNEEYVSSIMYDELKKNVGVNPKFSVEKWGEPAHEH